MSEKTFEGREYESSPLKAIRAKCIDCSGGLIGEVRSCPSRDCPLYPFRFARNPFIKRNLTDAEKAKIAERLPQNQDGEDDSA